MVSFNLMHGSMMNYKILCLLLFVIAAQLIKSSPFHFFVGWFCYCGIFFLLNKEHSHSYIHKINLQILRQIAPLLLTQILLERGK